MPSHPLKLTRSIALGAGCFLASLFSSRLAHAQVTARTDLATVSITPIMRQPNATVDWRSIYDYSGGELPAGTRVTAVGKWINPIVRQDTNGLTYAFPPLPPEPQAGQFLRTRFSVERPLANFPTRITVKFALHRDPSHDSSKARWRALDFTTTDLTNFPIFSVQSPDSINLTGENTVVFSFDGSGKSQVTVNDKPVADLAKRLQLKPAGASLLSGISLAAGMTQLAGDKGDWYSLRAVKIEQLRPALETSASAAIDLDVPGPNAARVSLEVLDAANASKGFVLRDALIPRGHHRLYWDGIEQKTSQPAGTAPLPKGAYTFRLTTSKTQVQYLGEINNSVPPYNAQSYAQLASTALAITPPGTAAPNRTLVAGPDVNPRDDTRRLDTTDSVQLVCVGYDSNFGGWIGADGTTISTRTGDARMQKGRGVALAPPDPSAPTNPLKQFFYTSTSITSAQAVTTAPLIGNGRVLGKTFSSPEWNRQKGFWPYKIRLGQVPDLLGSQSWLFFKMGFKSGQTQAEWVFRNIRLYEEGQPEPAPLTFDVSRFTPRSLPGQPKCDAETIVPGTLSVEDNGYSVRLKNVGSVNYPLLYTVTPKTILAFDLFVVDKGNANFGAGLGLDSSPEAKRFIGYRGFFNFLPRDLRWGFQDSSIGAYAYPDFQPNTLYTDTIPPFPASAREGITTRFLFQRGFYGLKISENGQLLFACNNADNRLEVHDIAGDGHSIAKIPIDTPMFVTLAPLGAAGAPAGVRYVYVDSPQAGLVKIAWKVADNSFGAPETITPATQFTYPRGLAYNPANQKIFVCDAYTPNHAKAANQIAVVDPISGRVLSRFGKVGGVDPEYGGLIDDDVFTCPLDIVADSKGALWVNDYFTGETRKYSYNATTGSLELLRRVLGPNTTNISHFYWLPGGRPNEVWTVGNTLTRHQADLGPNGRFTNQRVTSAQVQLDQSNLRPYAHFTRFDGHVFLTFAGQGDVFEQVGDGWTRRFQFGGAAGDEARAAGLISPDKQTPTDLDKAIAASGDAEWEKRPWAWSDLNGDGKKQFTATNPEFKIAFNSHLQPSFGDPSPSTTLRASDGAYIYPDKSGLTVVTPQRVNGQLSYDWSNSKIIPYAAGPTIMDVLAQDNRFYTMGNSLRRHDVGSTALSSLDAYDATGKLLWRRGQSDYSLTNVASVGDGLIATTERSWFGGLVTLRNSESDVVCQVASQEMSDTWAPGTLRVDADTAYIGFVQVYKVTGLASVKSASVTVNLSGY